MPFDKSERSIDFDRGHDSSVALNFFDVYDKSRKTIQASAREVGLVTTGTVTGAFNEFQKDPVTTALRAGSTFVVGAGLGAMAAAEAPVIAAGAIATGAIFTGIWAIDTLNPFDARNQARFSKIGTAMNDVWYHSDKSTFDQSLQKMQEGAGPIALDVGLMALGAKGAQLGARNIPGLAEDFNFWRAQELAPNAIPSYYEMRSAYSQFDPENFALYKRRSGRAKVDLGPPETIDTRLAELDKAKGITNDSSNPNKVDRYSATERNIHKLLTPAQEKAYVKTFYYKTRYRDLQ